MNIERPQYAGFWIRVGATLIDEVLGLVITMPILVLIYGKEYSIMSWRPKGTWDVMLSYVFPVVATILFWRFKQATPGNMLTRTRLVDETTGGALTTGQCVWRCFGLILAALPLCLGFLRIAWDSKKQGWHDKLASTLVLRKSREIVSST